MSGSLRDHLGEHALFEGLGPDHLDTIAALATEYLVPPGTMLCREGEHAGGCYVLRSGRVALEVHGPAGTSVLTTLGPGDMLGWSWLFPPFRWRFDARAVTEVDAIAFDGPGLVAAADADPTLGYPLLQRLLQMSVERLQHARFQQLDVYGTLPGAPGASP